jgi:hypothetical protein
MDVLIFTAHDLVVAEALFAVFLFLGQRFSGAVRNRFGVRCPGETGN